MSRALATAVVLAAACGRADRPSEPTKPLVVTTVAPITSIVRNVAGDHVDVRGIVPEGTDSHTFEPRPRDAKLFAQADLVLVNGLHLETPTQKLAAANIGEDIRIVELGESTITQAEWIFDFSFPREHGDPNPHLWMNPLHAASYADVAAQELSRIDTAHASDYRENAAAFASKIAVLDEKIREAAETVPAEKRKLLTYHDSFAYFAPRYGFKVIGAIQPSDFSEPSPQEVARLVKQIRDEGVPAVFGSEVFPSTVLDQIAKETGIEFVTTLRDDDLPGGKDSAEHTYFGMMVEDVKKIVGSLGGDPKALNGFPVQNV